MVRHLLTLKELTPKEVETIIDMGLDIKKNPSKYSTAMKDKTLCMIFQKTSTRTRLSFETGMTRMGGHAIFLDWRTTQLGMSDIKDEIKVIASYDDIIMARVLRHETVHEMAKWSKVPVINGLCEKYHPCQILGDLMTVKEHFGKLKGLKMAYVGLANNVSNTLTIGCMKTGMDFVLSAPERHPISLDEELLKEAKASGHYFEEKDPKKAVKGADIVYTDTWVDMEFFNDPKFEKEKERRMKTFLPYQLNLELLGGSKAKIMHDMPMHVGYEISRDAIESENSILFDQAENRMHIQNAIMVWLLKK